MLVCWCVVCCFTVSLFFNACDVKTKLAPDKPSPRRNKTQGGRLSNDLGKNKTWHALQIGAAAANGRPSISSHSVAGSGQLIFARGGYPRLILLQASRADALITPEKCVLHSDREVHAAQFQHHVIPRYWATECEGCTIFQPIGMCAPARTCFTPIPREFPIHCMVWTSPAHGPALSLTFPPLPRTPKCQLVCSLFEK